MSLLLISIALFLAAYLINMFFITVLYHRGLAHEAVKLSPFTMKLLQHTGVWVTGIDPKAWACMHRLHHTHSDTALDPHSPVHIGVMGVAIGQLKSYERILVRLIKKDRELTSLTKDIPFDIHYLNRNRLWYVPYVAQLALGVALALMIHPWAGIAYFLGMMSHPVQGWLVNAFAHKVGYRNYNTDDESKNNTWLGILIFGEGFQNNHHAYPRSANFAKKWFELDMGYWMCLMAEKTRMLKISHE